MTLVGVITVPIVPVRPFLLCQAVRSLMSNLSRGSVGDRKCKKRLDYLQLHREGLRVEKVVEVAASPSMGDAKKLEVEARRLKLELDELIDLNPLDEFSDIDLINDHIADLTLLSRKFKSIHYDLEDILGDEDYQNRHPQFTSEYDKFKKEIKNAKSTKSNLAKKIERMLECSKVTDQIQLNVLKLDGIMQTAIDQMSVIEEIRLSVREVSELRITCDFLLKKLVDLEGDGLLFEPSISQAKQYILDGKSRIDLLLKTSKDEDEQLQKSAETELSKRQTAIVTRLLEEIKYIETSLIALKDVTVEDLSDEHLLELQKGLRDFQSKCDALSEKITHLHSEMPLSFAGRETIVKTRSEKEKDSREALKCYKELIEKEIANRNVSKDKLASNESLKISLEKFSGFDSSLDIYSFQTEFEKLLVPNVTAKLLPDYLKYNYLDGVALTLVKGLDTLSEIWDRLKEAYGDTDVLLRSKLREVESLGPIWKCKSKNKLVQILSKLVYVMVDLQELAVTHSIENDLYHGGAIQKVYSVLGHKYRDKFIRKHVELELSKKEKWAKLIEFVKSELKVEEEIALAHQQDSSFSTKTESVDTLEHTGSRKSYNSVNSNPSDKSRQCILCGELNHVVTRDHFGRHVVQYFACKMFVEMSCKERLKLLLQKGLCIQCLAPGATVEHGKHKEGTCFSKFACKNQSHSKFPRKKHVLLCEEHKEDSENAELLEKYKKESILKFSSLPEFSRDIKLFIAVSSYAVSKVDDYDESEIVDSAIYAMQTIKVVDESVNMFYDSGCNDSCSSKQGVDKLEKLGRAKQLVPGPLQLKGVGDIITVSEHGAYKLTLETCDGDRVSIRGLCLTQITCKFPKYPLKEIESDIRDVYKAQGGDLSKLPRLPQHVGGETEIMLGSKYLKYHPVFVFQMPNGLRIYKSCFLSVDGTRGVIGGPHRVITEVEKRLEGSFMTLGTYLSQQLSLFRAGIQLDPDVQLLAGVSMTRCDIETYECIVESTGSANGSFACVNCGNTYRSSSSKKSKLFEIAENAGSEVNYRCIKCRNCADCKKSGEVQCISIQEEVEQDMIDKSVHVQPDKGITVASLPFLQDPETTLSTNRQTAMSVYRGQVARLNRNPEEKQEVLEAERKMNELGFVAKLDDLSEEQIRSISESKVQHFLPWRVTHNDNSLSTPARLVYDGSMITPSGHSLNSILAKGRNNMNKLVEILIRWFVKRSAYHTDIRKMYSSVQLDEKDWCYQLYLWHDDLSAHEEPIVKVIKTLIWGVKSSGNQAESALRTVARMHEEETPEASRALLEDTYVDDCVSGVDSDQKRSQLTDEMQIILSTGGFSVKGFTCSGSHPPADLTKDGVSVNVAGLKWYSKDDKISLEAGDLNFSKKKRGKKSSEAVIGVPENFTRRDCVSKVAELFDLVGKVTPITCAMKLDLRVLVERRLDWDDPVPSDLKSLWIQHFKTLQGLAEIQYNRSVVPEDAVSLDIDTIELGDASDSLICAAVYARFLRKNGSYSCQLVFSRSKLVPPGMSIPRAELLAAHLNATIGHIVHLAFKDLHKDRIKLTDSQVSLFWISSTDNPLKQWTRNKSVDINRLAPRENWFYIKSADNIADMGTRRGSTIADVSSDSQWINGFDWMHGPRDQFPVFSVEEIKFQQTDVEAIRKESLRPEIVDVLFSHTQEHPLSYLVDSSYAVIRKVDSKVLSERYKFADYVIDPNRFRLRKVVRVLALVMRFVRNFVKKWSKDKTVLVASNSAFSEFSKNILTDLSIDKYLVTCGNVYAVSSTAGLTSYVSCQPGLVVPLTDEDLILALNYFYQKSTLEVKHFVDKKVFEKISVEKDGILYYSGRILPSQEYGSIIQLSDVMLDLTASTFSVPLIDSSSPFAYAVVNEVHWYHPVAMHSGNETVWRYVLKYAYLIGGKEVVRSFRLDCARCRYLAKRTVDVVMGPVSKFNLMLAPAFYISQVDLFGPLKAFSLQNKRGNIKIWFLVFCCCTTGAVSLKVMYDYSSSAFMSGFIRFSCAYGYPKMLLPDEGSQLVKGCKEMQLTFTDIKQRLHIEYGVEYEACPVGGHNMHGKVERKIQQVKQAISKSLDKERLSPLQWETVGDQIANCINDTPLAMRYVPKDVEHIDLLTPNRLLLGRNNERSPSGPLCTNFNPDKMIEQNERIVTAWFECWLISHVPLMVDRPKWFHSDSDIQVGDVVLFLKKDKEYAGNYQYGIVQELKVSKDGRIREVVVEYVNHNQADRKQTRRSVRELVVIHPLEELGIVRELGEIAAWVDMKRKVNSTCSQ